MVNNIDIYKWKIKASNGTMIDFNDFKGKTILIVNTATKCGFARQFDGLNKLHEYYNDLVVIGFPCDQFMNQEPITNEEMAQVCALNFGAKFILTEKINVNGKDAHPIFRYLKDALPGTLTNSIKWNFTKFLIDSNGIPLKRFAPFIKPEQIEQYLRDNNLVK